MAVLLDPDRIIIRNEISQGLSDVWESFSLTKTELKAAVDATDLWISNNQAAYNAALPTNAQTGLTKQQKARLFLKVAEKRFNVDI